MWQEVLQASQRYPLPAEYTPSYGTAGFRSAASHLPSTVFRCALLMVARSRLTGSPTGIMITASHNPEGDNGVKLIEGSGHMLAPDWEERSTRLAGASSDSEVVRLLQSFTEQQQQRESAAGGEVWLAHDTRPSAPELMQAAQDGIAALQAKAIDWGLLTTPQLHWLLWRHHCGLSAKVQDYFRELTGAYVELRTPLQAPSATATLSKETLTMDCASGVGAQALGKLAAHLKGTDLQLQLRNTGQPGQPRLNDGCGADFVQKSRTAPQGLQPADLSGRCASIDGDADRLVFFFQQDGRLQLLDGDRIALLMATLVSQLLGSFDGGSSFALGVVQTAYANGAAMKYAAALPGARVVLTATGVKHLHRAAEEFDVGIYFEANGHGTVLFTSRLLQSLRQELEARGKDAVAVRQLLALSRLANQAVGDALSGLLMVDAALTLTNWDLPTWLHMYRELPSRQLKAKVADRSVITTVDAETKVVTPAGLQAAIDMSVSQHESGRAFVRPSGTEDAVRVYAEAATQAGADALAQACIEHVQRLAGGTGPE